MIVTITQEIKSKMARENELSNIRDNEKAIKATYNELKQLNVLLRKFVTLYQVVHKHLPVTEKSRFIAEARQIQTRIKELHERFASKPRQASELRRLKGQIEKLTQQTQAAWRVYAYEQVKPHLELLKLVKQLPEIATQADAINQLQRQLQAAIDKPPNTAHALNQFDHNIQALDQRLANLSNLDPSVRRFLYKVLQNQATMADLSPEILAWCRQEGRARAFKISFK